MAESLLGADAFESLRFVPTVPISVVVRLRCLH